MTHVKQLHRLSGGRFLPMLAILSMVIFVPVFAQHHDGNWVHRNATDTTFVHCSNDSMTMVGFPPGSMMGMMGMPDSVYCRIDRMSMDSLFHPHDSTLIGWHRMQIGRDSMQFDLMNSDSMMGGHSMMQFMKGMPCRVYWDSLMTDSMHRHWRPTGMMAWNGSQWEVIPGIVFTGNIGTFALSKAYSAYAFVGEPADVLSVGTQEGIVQEFALQQNYPNPFNPSTEIRFSLPSSGFVVMKVYNVLGNEIAVLLDNQMMSGGSHVVRFDAAGVSSGVYFYTLQSGQFKQTRKMLFMR